MVPVISPGGRNRPGRATCPAVTEPAKGAQTDLVKPGFQDSDKKKAETKRKRGG